MSQAVSSERWFYGGTVGLAVLLTLPTLHGLLYCGFNDPCLSSAADKAWHWQFWQDWFPQVFANKTMGVVVIDGLRTLVIAAMAALYLWQMNRYRKGDTELSLPTLLGWTVLVGAVLLWVVPFHSKDLYGYINRGAQQALFHINPYLHPLMDTPGWQHNPMFHAHWVDNPSPYGFFFTRLTSWLVWLGGGTFWAAFLGFKLMSLGVHVAITTLVFWLSGRLGLSRPGLSAWLFAFNPLLLLHLVANGHNDGWVALGALGFMACLTLPKSQWFALPVLVVSVFTKYAALLALPLLGLLLIHRRLPLWPQLLGFGVAMVLVASLAWPYLDDWHQLPFAKMGENAGLSHHSLNAALGRTVMILSEVLPILNPVVPVVKSMFKPWLWGGFALVLLWQCWCFWRRSAVLKTLEDSVLSLNYGLSLLLLILLAVVSPKFHPWYVGMVLPLALVLPAESWVRRAALLWSLFQLLSFTPLHNLHVFNWVLLSAVPLVLAWRKPGLLNSTRPL